MQSALSTIAEASKWATKYLNRPVNVSNISYLIQYAKINKHKDGYGKTLVDINELKAYYDSYIIPKENSWKQTLGDDIDWHLSFDQLPEFVRTKHVHRLHPYKGKFIPQLVEYFIDGHTDEFKTEVYFKPGDILLDPFVGSGTTLVQAMELGINSIGIDISEFNCLISKVKTDSYDLFTVRFKLEGALQKLEDFDMEVFNNSYDQELKERISRFNSTYFPVPEFKNKVRKGFDDDTYGREKLAQFFNDNYEFYQNNGVKSKNEMIPENEIQPFISRWFTKRIRQEISFYIGLINKENDPQIADVMKVILSRSVRSCRATTHSDLATLKEPQYEPYYCTKHYKICTPVNTILDHLRKYTYDTIERLDEFSRLKKDGAMAIVLHGDSRTLDIGEALRSTGFKDLSNFQESKISGVFTSPPYVGQIDYHEQHAYAYEMFGFKREDESEIGAKYKGGGRRAQKEYVEGISEVLRNISKYVKNDGTYIIVANDKFNLYPEIAEVSNLKIVKTFKRPVLNRTERDRQPYSESIFIMKRNPVY
ncbi:MAG: DNA methyltransferase [Thermoplasmata archaeon]